MSDHYLVVGPFDLDDTTDRFDVEHPADCPKIEAYHGCPTGPIMVENCAVAHHVDFAGIDGWFQHADDPAPDDAHRQRVPEGRHQIEAWFETVRHAYGVEHDGGLQVVDSGAS